ncbi:glycosyltransferase family 2 protein [Candidatus Woesearchaeota archaeon]|nr:glycosyltransferase family 2 protein [Candidatus Woesearchaeota archaeon]
MAHTTTGTSLPKLPLKRPASQAGELPAQAVPLISVVIPVYNEEQNIAPLYACLKQELDKLSCPYEILFVDDGSTDATFNEIEKVSTAAFSNRGKSAAAVRCLSFSRNFKKSAALSAGFAASHGKYILTMDGDLQEDPKDIPLFIEKMKEGYDMVVGWKYDRQDSLAKRFPSAVFNFLIRTVNHLDIHDCDCNYRLMRKSVIDKLQLYGGLYRFIPILAKNEGFKVGEVKIQHHPRLHGKSKYGFSRLFQGFFDFLTISFLSKYIKRPMHFFGLIGFFLCGIGFLGGLYLLYLRLILDILIGGRPMLLLVVLLIVLGFQFISIGLIGEMMVSMSAKDHKNYIVRREI